MKNRFIYFQTLAKINGISKEEAESIYLEAGKRIGPSKKYEVIKLIGVGSIGAVYLVKDYLKNKIYTLKVILPCVLKNKKRVDLFLEKFEKYKALSHSNNIKIEEIWKKDEQIGYLMEYIEGISLKELLKIIKKEKKKFSLLQGCNIILNICKGTQAFHKISEHYLLHPNNILIGKNGEIKIIDFGIFYLNSKDFWIKAGKFLDTYSYLAPEFKINTKEKTFQYPKKSDIYSIGTIFSEIISILYLSSKTSTNIPKLIKDIIFESTEDDLNKRISLETFIEKLEYFLKNYPKEEIKFRDIITSIFSTDKKIEKDIKELKEYINKKMFPKTLEKGRKLLKRVKYNKKISHKVEKILEEADKRLKEALLLKEKAKKIENKEEILELLKKSLEIYPYDNEAKELYKKIERELNEKKDEIQIIIEEGDKLVEENKLIEAIEKWKTLLPLFDKKREKEIKDRIMQVVDIIAENSKDLLDKGEVYKAINLIKKALNYSDDPYIKEIAMEIESEIEEREKTFKNALEEGEKHFKKNQFQVAIDIWKGALGVTDKDDILLKKIEKAEFLMKKMEEDEKEYNKLSSMIRNLEKKEDYKTALDLLIRIKERRKEWICRVPDPSSEIERFTKLSAASSYSNEALKLIEKVSTCLKENKLKEAEEILQNRIFKRILPPSIEKRYSEVCKELEKIKIKKRYKFIRFFIIITILVWIIVLFFILT